MNATEPAPTVQTPLDQMGPALRAQIQRLEAGAGSWKIPALSRRYQPAAGMHYHFCPELFILTGGECDFQFAGQKFTASADDPAFIVESEKSGNQAAHKRSALRKLSS